ncbi:nidogen and egf domain-containing protein 1, partial [Biomphalaria glabrata]
IQKDGFVVFNNPLVKSADDLSDVNNVTIASICPWVSPVTKVTMYYRLTEAEDEVCTYLAGVSRDHLFLDVDTPFNPLYALVVTWIAYGSGLSGDGSTKKNVFQLVIATDTVQSLAVMWYEQMEWISIKDVIVGTEDVQKLPEDVHISTVAGFFKGDGQTHELLPISMSKNVFSIMNDTNVEVPGQYIFRIDGAPMNITWSERPISGDGKLTLQTSTSEMVNTENIIKPTRLAMTTILETTATIPATTTIPMTSTIPSTTTMPATNTIPATTTKSTTTSTPATSASPTTSTAAKTTTTTTKLTTATTLPTIPTTSKPATIPATTTLATTTKLPPITTLLTATTPPPITRAANTNTTLTTQIILATTKTTTTKPMPVTTTTKAATATTNRAGTNVTTAPVSPTMSQDFDASPNNYSGCKSRDQDMYKEGLGHGFAAGFGAALLTSVVALVLIVCCKRHINFKKKHAQSNNLSTYHSPDQSCDNEEHVYSPATSPVFTLVNSPVIGTVKNSVVCPESKIYINISEIKNAEIIYQNHQ